MMDMLTPDFIIGCIFGFIIGTIIVETIWYNYWKRELYPLYLFKKSKETEEKLYELLEKGVDKEYYTKEELK